jgi:hypothetical protein
MFAADALVLAAAIAAAPDPSDALTRTFDAAAAGEAVATIRAGCARCDWAIRVRNWRQRGGDAAVWRCSPIPQDDDLWQ